MFISLTSFIGFDPQVALGNLEADLFVAPVPPAPSFAHAAFKRTWERTERPLNSGTVKRSWYWGPTTLSNGLQETYVEGQHGTRLVQYFDKGRMEINAPSADPLNAFYVTSGLLTIELMSGKMQVGNSSFIDRYPADIPLASDPDDASAPTYMSFRGVSDTPLGQYPSPNRVGQPATQVIARDGNVTNDPTKGLDPQAVFQHYEPLTKHNVPRAIWQFLNEVGPIYDSESDGVVQGRPSDPWFYMAGLPVSEPYWTHVKVAGRYEDVLVQAFERRIITYMPNGEGGFKVQMGNIGQHYYDWRYKDSGRPSGPVSPPATITPLATHTPAIATPTPISSSCTGIASSINMIIQPSNCAPAGTTFYFTGYGFQPGEQIRVYIVSPDPRSSRLPSMSKLTRAEGVRW